jgi:4'-phosphopantetheinyl transferase
MTAGGSTFGTGYSAHIAVKKCASGPDLAPRSTHGGSRGDSTGYPDPIVTPRPGADLAISEVFVIRLDALPSRPFARLLSYTELQRADRFSTPPLRSRFIVAHGALRAILGSHLTLDPRTVPITRRPCAYCSEPHGKPELAEPFDQRAHFSMSRRDGLALIATSRHELGVDIEKVVPRVHMHCLPATAISNHERQGILSLPGEERQPAFFRWWTRKEACAKALGEGVPGFHRLVVSVPPHPPKLLRYDGRDVRPGAWTVADLQIGPGHVAALAVQGSDRPPPVLRMVGRHNFQTLLPVHG